MSDQRAHVTSVEALESFRASLIVYVTKARATLEEISAEATRTRLWLQDEKRVYWEGQVRRRTRELERAQQALLSVRISNLRDASVEEQNAVRRAKQAWEAAHHKLRRLKAWDREFDSRVQPLVKQLEKLHSVLANDMPRAAAYLAQAVTTLDAYADVAPQRPEGTPPPSGGSGEAESTASEGGGS